jgi:hypothetical protein
MTSQPAFFEAASLTRNNTQVEDIHDILKYKPKLVDQQSTGG